MKQDIMFDLDGTLWNSSEELAHVWNNLFNHLNIKAEVTGAQLRQYMGKNLDVIFDMLFPEAGANIKDEFLNLCEKAECEYLVNHGGAIYPNVIEGLKALKKDHNLYIISNCQKGYIEAFLSFYELWDLFKDYECSGNTGMVKSENIKLIKKRNQVSEAVYIGDTEGDREAAEAAGVDFIHIGHGFGNVTVPCEEVNDFNELIAKLNV